MDLSTPDARNALAASITKDIDDWCVKTFDDGHRNHLGASLIGDDCLRKLFYGFRWVKREKHSGRMLRLFQTGHREEARYLEYLVGIGFSISSTQERISDCNGHFGGSNDGEAVYNGVTFLLEFKTNGTGRGYNEVSELGVRRAKPKHWAQMCTYGFKRGIKYALYMIKNKNDDDLTIQILELDWQLGEEMIRKASFVIESETAPPRISGNPAFFDCKFCNFAGVCHKQHAMEKNCRSCVHSKPVENAAWFCKHWGTLIPSRKEIEAGCDNWRAVG